jgi:hypothetical protein
MGPVRFHQPRLSLAVCHVVVVLVTQLQPVGTIAAPPAACCCDDARGPNQPAGSSKKLLEWGWDEPDTDFMRRNISQMEQRPFDGLVFHVNSSRGGNFVWEMWGGRRFESEEFQTAVEDLRATGFQRFTERFLRVNVTPGNVDWFDDNAWGDVLANFGVAARIVQQGGCRGFMFDVEQYQHKLFSYDRQSGHSFDDCRKIVRQRGREWIREVNSHCPEITILMTFGYALARPESVAGPEDAPCGLLADFLDGVLDECSEQTVLVDAWEQAYSYRTASQFEDASETIHHQALNWTTTPEKYRQHVRAAFGLWLDYDWRKRGWNTTDFSQNYFTPAAFREPLRAALTTSDEYVWIYTERPKWWTGEQLPAAYVEAVSASRNVPDKN